MSSLGSEERAACPGGPPARPALGLIGESAAFRKATESLPTIAASDATVLVSGETGTGKEIVARALHYVSPRAPHPFLAVNCGALPDTLLESELFGHERGAFTDAQSRRVGLIPQAGRGTLFLDELEALSPRAQVALLRVLQDGRYRALGSEGLEQRAWARFIGASNVDLEPLMKAGSFRADLYYRLRILTLHLPPLRERQGDIPLLAGHFVRKHARGHGPSLSAEAVRALLAHDWPGNVRELENVILRAVLLRPSGAIGVEDLGLRSAPASGVDGPLGPFRELKRRAVETFERDYLTRLMSECEGNVSRAARLAGKERRDLGRLLKKHRLHDVARWRAS